MDLADAQRSIALFIRQRDWNQFDCPKNLVMALAVECAELMEIFQWLTSDEAERLMDDEKGAERVRNEMADVFAYLLRLANVLDIDLLEAFRNKMAINVLRYPIGLARGSARKHSGVRMG